MTKPIQVLSGVLAMALSCPVYGQTTWYVDVDNCAGVGSGTLADPYCEIQSCIAAAPTIAGDECVVAPGVYEESIDFLGKAITVRSSDGPESTIIDATGVQPFGSSVSVVRCVSGETATTVLDGFTITGGTGDVSVFSDPVGGGMFNDSSSPTVINCRFIGNSVTGGFTGGGAMFNNSSSPTVTHCTFNGNTSEFVGGGMANVDSSNPTVINCTFSGNTAGIGGGIVNTQSSNPIVTNCILWGNTPDDVFTDSSTPTIGNSDIGGSGGSVAWDPALGTDGGGNLDVDPLFVDENGGQNDNLRLCRLSPCVDAGDNNVVIEAFDLDDNPRIVNAIVDMGAYENQVAGPPSVQTFTVTNINDSGLGSLRQAILDANATAGADTIELDPAGFPYDITLSSTLPVIIDDLTIDGGDSLFPQVNISGGGAVRVMQVSTCATVTLITVRIHHGESETGAGILNEGVLDLVGCWVEQNSTGSGSDGGGIYNAGTLTFESGSISSNYGEYGGGIYNAGTATITNSSISSQNYPATDQGGGIYNTGTLTVSNCEIDNNIAFDGGGAIYNEMGGDATVSDSAFTGNGANWGGAINNRGTLAVTSCTFGDFGGDPFDSPNTAARGGAIYNGDEYLGGGDVTISMSTFEDNYGTFGGGAIENQGDTMTIEGSTFDLNRASGFPSSSPGGAIKNARTFGGNEPALTVIDCRFRSNSCGLDGGGISNEFGTLTVIDSTFLGNRALSGEGGGIRNWGGDNLTVINSTFARNTATSVNARPDRDFAGGGGIWSHGIGAVISNCTFSDNHAVADEDGGGSGGGIMVWAGTMAITNCTFVGNDADVDGGGIYDLVGQATVKNTLIVDSTGGNCSGLIPYLDNTHNMSDTGVCGISFTQVALADLNLGLLADNGGPAPAHALLFGSVAIDAGDPATCAADPVNNLDQRGAPRPVDGDGIGGAVCDIGAVEYQAQAPSSVLFVNAGASGLNDGSSWADAFLSLTDAMATAEVSGGIVSEIWVAKGTYTPDGGSEGGGNLVNGTDERAATFQLLNLVALYGGFAGGETGLSQRDVEANPTILSGDLGLNVSNGTSVCTVDSPDCDNWGGLCRDGWCRAPHVNSYHVVTGSGVDVTAVLDGFVISDGSANVGSDIDGGGMWTIGGDPTVVNCTFRDNEADGDGAGMYNESSGPEVKGCTFVDNRAEGDGGGMYNRFASPVVNGCMFRENTAGHQGGGMCNFNSNSNPTVVNSSFVGNVALSSFGGGIFSRGNSVIITNATFTGNSAVDDGGGLHSGSGNGPTVMNSIFWNNQPSEITGGAPVVNYSLVQGGWAGAGGVGIIDADPQFVDPEGTGTASGQLNLHLCAGSLAIDAGDTNALPPGTATDADGDPRFVDDPGTVDTGVGTPPLVDMGAYEHQPFFQTLVFVNPNAAGANDGTSWPDAFVQMQDALTRAAVFEERFLCDGTITEIWVAAGTHRPDAGAEFTPDDKAATFQLRSGVAVYGGFAGGETDLSQRDVAANLTILTGDLAGNDDPAEFPDGPSFTENSYHVVTGSDADATAVLDGFTVTGGNASTGSGGGMYNYTGIPTVRNCRFIRNSAAFEGGGLFTDLPNMEGSPVVTDSVFIQNAADFGGGISIGSATPEVTRCTFIGNRAETWGGGTYFSRSGPMVTHCTFSGNRAELRGGGMAINFGWIGVEATVIHCAFSGNTADEYGGGISFINQLSAPGYNPIITNCIFWGNVPNLADFGPPPTINYCIVQGGWSDPGSVGLVVADPLFVDADGADNLVGTEDDDLRLLPGSPAIDAGDNAAVPVGVTTDLDGNPRFVDDTSTVDTGTGTPPIVDMGAYEYLPPVPSDFDHDGDVDGDDVDAFEVCASGPAVLLVAGCEYADLDGDTDVDQSDFGIVQRCFSGEDITADPNCAN